MRKGGHRKGRAKRKPSGGNFRKPTPPKPELPTIAVPSKEKAFRWRATDVVGFFVALPAAIAGVVVSNPLWGAAYLICAVIIAWVAISLHHEVHTKHRFMVCGLVLVVIGPGIGFLIHQHIEDETPRIYAESRTETLPLSASNGIWCFYMVESPVESSLQQDVYPEDRRPPGGIPEEGIRVEIVNRGLHELDHPKLSIPITLLKTQAFKSNPKLEERHQSYSLTVPVQIGVRESFVFYIKNATGHDISEDPHLSATVLADDGSEQSVKVTVSKKATPQPLSLAAAIFGGRGAPPVTSTRGVIDHKGGSVYIKLPDAKRGP